MKYNNLTRTLLDYIIFLIMFLSITLTIYMLEFIMLIVKNIINGSEVFNFPIGFIYIGFQ